MALAPMPVVDELWTRCLEERAIETRCVRSAEVLEAEPLSLVLGTSAAVRIREDIVTDWAPGRKPSGERVGGTLRLDLVASGVIRVRYAEGEPGELPAGDTPMLVGGLQRGSEAGAGEPRVDDEHGTVTWDIGAATLEVRLSPLVLTVRSADSTVCEIGGREKNFFRHWDAHNTSVSRTTGDRPGLPLATECFALRPGEAVYGFGEQFMGGIDKVGQTVDLVMVEATGTTTPRSYKNIPFFWTTAGYGAFFNTSARMTAWVGSRAAADVQVAIEDDHLDWFLILGDPETILGRYTDVTGKAAVPPRWSFGWWQSKISYQSADETLDVVRRLREAEVPVDLIHLDTHWFREDWRCDLEFDSDRFPDPEGYLRELGEMGVKVCLWQLPYVPEGSAYFDELEEVGGFVRTAAGELYDVGICYTPYFEGRVGIIDFTNPAGVEVYQRWIRRLLEMGARAIKADFGEQAPLDGVYHDGTPGHLAHNLYPLLYNRAVAEVTREVTGEDVMWGRSAWAGSQRYPLHWGGDSSANWHNLRPQMVGGLSFGLSGFSFWSQDIGGFLGEPSDELLARWVQAGVFLSHARIHGMGRRELDAYGPEALAICRDYVRLRYRLLPYLWATAADSAQRSVPMARPLVVAFPDDPGCWRVDDQWLLGDDLLVAPIMNPEGSRRVYVPPGRWWDWWGTGAVEGPGWIDRRDVPLDRLPLWVREGAAVPLAPPMLHVDERPIDELELVVAPFGPEPSRPEWRLEGPLDDHRSFTIAHSPTGRWTVTTTGGPDVDVSVRSLGG